MSDFGKGKANPRFRKGSCVICGKGTDTAIMVRGRGEFAIGVLRLCGVSEWEAAITISNCTGCDIGKIPVGEFDTLMMICVACAQPLGVEPALRAIGQPIPMLRERPT